MITIPRSEFDTRKLHNMRHDELQFEHEKAQGQFDQARLRKQEADHVHVAAARELNMIDRLIEKAERRVAVERRAAAKSLLAAAKAGTS